MASCWIERRIVSRGKTRYRVRFRTGGAESTPRLGGTFKTMREAKARQAWVFGELAGMRVPNFRLLDDATERETLANVAERWRTSRLDVSEGTAATHRVNLGRILPRLGSQPIADIKPATVAGFVGELSTAGLARESIRKTVATLAMVFDFDGIAPNPARDRAVRLPREDKVEVNPPTATHVLAVHALLPKAYRLALLVLDATGMRVGELEALNWGDVDELAVRWRVTAAAAKTRRARWVPVHSSVFDAVRDLVPREDRNLDAQVFADFGADKFRTALTRACKATGVPAFSPHQLRHRRATLWHLNGVPVAEAASWLGHSAQEHLKTYAHAALVDRSEVDYATVLVGDRVTHTRMHTPIRERI
jgi:integrase